MGEEDYENLHIVLGVVEDKSIDRILPLFPKNAKYYFCQASIPRSLPAALLQSEAHTNGLIGNAFKTVESAFLEAKENAGDKDFIYVGGSTFVVADLLTCLQKG